MFGIGLPELILIMAVALIVVGPEKLPELAKTLAKQVVELKRAANALKDSLHEDEEKPAWQKITPERPQIAEHAIPVVPQMPSADPALPGYDQHGPSASDVPDDAATSRSAPSDAPPG